MKGHSPFQLSPNQIPLSELKEEPPQKPLVRIGTPRSQPNPTDPLVGLSPSDFPLRPSISLKEESSRTMHITYIVNTSSELHSGHSGKDNAFQPDPSASESILLLSILKDATSYGGDRTIKDYIKTTLSFIPHPSRTTLALMIASESEYRSIRKYLLSLPTVPFASVELYYSLMSMDHLNFSSDRGQRHSPNIQVQRRRFLAVLRNTLMYAAFGPKYSYVIWFDADVMEIKSTDMTQKAIASGFDIVVPACYIGNSYYDRNTWIGERTIPRDNEAVPDSNGNLPKGKSLFVPMHKPGRSWFLDHPVYKGKQFVEIDSVGGT